MVNNMKNNNHKRSSLRSFINKFLLCTIIFLSIAIISKSNINYKEKIYNYIYKTNINFSTFKKIYNKYLGGVSSLKESNTKELSVFDEKLKYKSVYPYEQGAKLEVDEKYLVPSIDKGIVTHIGKKDKYNNVIIIENEQGISTWYGNICNTNLKLYDNVSKNNNIGESCNNYIYIVFTKDKKYLDYKNYL